MRRELALVVLAACAVDDGAPALVPDHLPVDAQQGPLRIVGLAPARYLHAADDHVGLVDDFAATIGGATATVVSADSAGVDVTLGARLPVGAYPLEVRADGAGWQVAAALTIDPVPCPAAPAGCTAFACPGVDHCYYRCAPRVWPSAASQCATLSLGCLATLSDADEAACVAAAAAEPAWIGLRQDNGAAEPAGGWGWDCPDGTSYPGWLPGEPDDAGDADCGAVGASGAWIDLPCNTQHPLICER